MSFFALMFALLIEQVRPLQLTNPVYEAARSWARWCSRSLDAGAVPHGWLAWAAVVAVPTAAALGLHWAMVWSFGWVGAVLSFALHAAILYATLGFRQFSHHFTAIRQALDAGDEPAARQALAAWKQVDASELPQSEIVRQVIEFSVLAAHRHVFAVLGWYALLAGFGLGPAGAVFYRMSEFAHRYFSRQKRVAAHVNPLRGSESLRMACEQAWYLVDYLPARLSALGFAIVGNFEDAVESWRNSTQGIEGQMVNSSHNDGVILAATSGSINVRLGGQVYQGETNTYREPQLAHLRSLVGLVWRCVILWMLLLALLTIARLLG